MSYKRITNLRSDSLFNVIDYEENLLQNDQNESINSKKFNLLAAHFILNDTDLDFFQEVNKLFRKILSKWPNLVSLCLAKEEFICDQINLESFLCFSMLLFSVSTFIR